MSAAASLKSGKCGLTDGSTAGQWRLPTKDELVRRAQNVQGFYNVQPYNYWSSSNYVVYTTHAWRVSMDVGYADFGSKVNNYYVWPVRGGQ